MGNVLHAKTANTSVDTTYASIQTIKYHLKSRNKTAIEYFRQCPLSKMYSNIRNSSAVYRRNLAKCKEDKEEKAKRLELKTTLQSKKDFRLRMEERGKKAKELHIQKLKKRNRLVTLNMLAAKRVSHKQ